MIGDLKDLMRSAATWPKEDQAELAAYAREIVARRTGVYSLTAEERAALNEGLAEAQRGEFVSEAGMDAFWKAAGVR